MDLLLECFYHPKPRRLPPTPVSEALEVVNLPPNNKGFLVPQYGALDMVNILQE